MRGRFGFDRVRRWGFATEASLPTHRSRPGFGTVLRERGYGIEAAVPDQRFGIEVLGVGAARPMPPAADGRRRRSAHDATRCLRCCAHDISLRCSFGIEAFGCGGSVREAIGCGDFAMVSEGGTPCLSASVTKPLRSECAENAPSNPAKLHRLRTMSRTAAGDSGSQMSRRADAPENASLDDTACLQPDAQRTRCFADDGFVVPAVPRLTGSSWNG